MNGPAHKYFIRQNLALLTGVFLCLYFAFHIIQGERGYLRLMSINSEIVDNRDTLAALQAEKDLWQNKVTGLRPDSLDKDLLEERVRYVLGYKHPDEIEIISAAD